MRKAKCPVCGQIQVRYNLSENNFVCICGHVMEHHPELCPIYHKEWGCIYSRGDPVEPVKEDADEADTRG